MILVALVAGVLGLVASWALRRPTKRARRAREAGGIADERMVLLSLPGVSLILLGVGLLGLVVPGIGGFLPVVVGVLLAIPCVAIAGFGIYLSFLGLTRGKIPEWLLPRR